VTTARRLELVSVAVVSLGASAAYYTMVMALRGHAVHARGLGHLLLGLVAALMALLLVLFWRKVNYAARSIAGQLERMAHTRQVGLVMTEQCQALDQITQPLNSLLTAVREEMDQLQADSRELEIRSRIAEAEKNRTEAIIFSISDAVVATNRFDELILANQAAERLLGFKLAHSLRKNIDHILDDGALVRLIRETRSGQRGLTRKVVEHSIDEKGHSRTFNVILSCVTAPQGEASGVVAVLHDITREREIARMKTDFVSNVSHELRTPLSCIKAYVEMLLDEEAGNRDSRREFYQIIAGEADRLNRLIDNILNISQIESGAIRVQREPLSLAEVAREVLDVVAPEAKTKNIALVDRLAANCRRVEADQDMISQALLNLTGNAIKYTPEGGQVTVSTGVDEHRGVAVCQVADTGVGISPEELPHVFDKFYRGSGHARIAKGTGLGLTLVKHIVETVHGGKLFVASELGKGSTFAFELPLVE